LVVTVGVGVKIVVSFSSILLLSILSSLALHVQIDDELAVLFDELAPRLDLVAH